MLLLPNLPPAEIRQYKPDLNSECYNNITDIKTFNLNCLDLGGYPFKSQGTPVNTTISGTSGTSNASGSIPGTPPLGTSPFGNTTSLMNPGFNGIDGSAIQTTTSLQYQFFRTQLNFVPRDGFLTGASNDWINIADSKFNQVEIRQKNLASVLISESVT